jgi:hypothetical protein
MMTLLSGAEAVEGTLIRHDERGLILDGKSLWFPATYFARLARVRPRLGERVRVHLDENGFIRDVERAPGAMSEPYGETANVPSSDPLSDQSGQLIFPDACSHVMRVNALSVAAVGFQRMLEILTSFGIPEEALQPDFSAFVCNVPPFQFLPEEDGRVARVLLLCADGCGRCRDLVSASDTRVFITDAERENHRRRFTIVRTFGDLHFLYRMRQGHENGEYVCAECQGTSKEHRPFAEASY